VNALERHLEIDGAHDAVAELLVNQFLDGRAVDLDQLVKTIDGRVDRRRLLEPSAHRNGLQKQSAPR
jgi:hypothetical protein